MTFGKYFCGNLISEYGRKNGRVDYGTLAKSFDAVLNNDIMGKTWGTFGEWEQESGFVDNSEEIDELNEEIDALESDLESVEELEETEGLEELNSATADAIRGKIDELRDRIEDLENEQDETPEIFQYYIIDDNGARILEDYTDEIVFYNSDLDMYLWGVTHWGTSWDYVLTSIPCEVDPEARA